MNVAPSPEGEWDEGAYRLLNEIGDWMSVNKEAIYGTRSLAPFKFNNVCVTAKPDGAVYLTYLVEKGQTSLPSEIVFPDYVPSRGAKAQLLGGKQKLKWTQKDEGMAIQLPKDLSGKLLETEAFVIKIK